MEAEELDPVPAVVEGGGDDDEAYEVVVSGRSRGFRVDLEIRPDD